MANIHSLRDIEVQDPSCANGGPNVPFPYVGGSTGGGARRSSEGLMLSSGSMPDPFSQPEPKCIQLFLPGFNYKSFIFGISVVQVIFYIVSLSLSSYALAPTAESLDKMGDSYGPAIQDGQVWRLLSPILLHATIWHLLFNLFFQLRMGFMIEIKYGLWKTVLLYIVSGLAGNLLSVAWAPCKRAVGASTAGFGLIGIQMVEIALNWHRLDRKDMMLFNIAFFVMITVLMSANPGSFIDWRGHLGGFVCGFCLGFAFNETMSDKPKWFAVGRWIAYGVLAFLFVSTTAAIFAVPMSQRCGV